jgi:hypothetical protein
MTTDGMTGNESGCGFVCASACLGPALAYKRCFGVQDVVRRHAFSRRAVAQCFTVRLRYPRLQ